MFKWHKKILNQMMDSLILESYQVAWNPLFKGVMLTVLFYEFFVNLQLQLIIGKRKI